jgi:predicted transposase/invertase (TIGR01784 family)
MKTKNHTSKQITESYTDGPTLIRFDWAIKRLLRQKANYTVLEGFLSVLINEKVKIVSITESESNQESAKDKYNRVDILVKNKNGEFFIIEMQNNSEADYFLRMLYGASKVITEQIKKGEKFRKIRKVYHINIVYFELGEGLDYVYRGVNEFRGIHHNDLLQLTKAQKRFFSKEHRKSVKNVSDLFTEYYILCVENFNKVAENSLDEWMYYFKNNVIPIEFDAPGLKEAREHLRYEQLSPQDKIDYDHHVDQILYEQNSIETAKIEGEAIGLEKGKAEGEAKAMKRSVIEGYQNGFSLEQIQLFTKLSIEQITEILKQHDLK